MDSAQRLRQGQEHHRQGRYAEAEAAYESVVAAEPGHAGAWQLLGLAALHRGDAPKAVAALQQAIARQANVPASHCNLSAAYNLLGDSAQAAASARTALRLQPAYPDALLNLGTALCGQQQWVEAEQAFRAALQARPHDAQGHAYLAGVLREQGQLAAAVRSYDLALTFAANLLPARYDRADLLRKLGRLDEAATAYRDVVQRDPERPEAYRFLAATLWDQGDAAGALACCRAALARWPTAAGFHASLGQVLAASGELAAAEASYREALRHDPRCVPAWACLATALRGGLPEADLGPLEALLSVPGLAVGQQAALHFGLAHVHDERGDYARAAGHMVQANALQKTHWAERGQVYDPAAHTRVVDRILEVFTPELFDRLAGAGSLSQLPVFLCGLPRSGTSLTEQILASHPQVFGAGERTFAFTALQRLAETLGQPADPFGCVAAADPDALAPVAAWHLDQLRQLDDGQAVRIVDKLPDNYQLLGLLAVLFPQARFLHCRRDVRDVALSCWLTNFGFVPWAADLEHIAHRIREYRRLMDHWRRVLPVPLLEVDYEELVADQEGVSRRLVAWLGLAWDPRCLAFHETPRLVRTASAAQIRRPLYAQAVGRWRHYEAMLAPLLAGLGERGA